MPAPTRESAHWLLPLLAASAVAVLLLRRMEVEGLPLIGHPLAALWCLFVLTYVAVASVSLLPAPLGAALDRWLDERLQQSGTGLYGVVALAVFLRLEAASFAEAWSATELEAFAGDLFREWLIGFSLESLLNSIRAMIWPASVISQHGWKALVLFLLACSAVFELGKRVLPDAHRRMQDPDEDGTDAVAAPGETEVPAERDPPGSHH